MSFGADCVAYQPFNARLESYDAAYLQSNGRTRTRPQSWPYTQPSPEDMALAGFFYAPRRNSPDNVKCFFCQAEIEGWELEDKPAQVHMALSPDCPFAQLTANPGLQWAVEHEQNSLRGTCYDPHYDMNYRARMSTFQNWPHTSNDYPSAISLALAGFYYTPTHYGDDTATCSLCPVALNMWDKGDNPYIEHQKQNPECLFFTSMSKKHGMVDTERRALAPLSSTRHSQNILPETTPISPEPTENLAHPNVSSIKSPNAPREESAMNASGDLLPVARKLSYGDSERPLKRKSRNMSEDESKKRVSSVRASRRTSQKGPRISLAPIVIDLSIYEPQANSSSESCMSIDDLGKNTDHAFVVPLSESTLSFERDVNMAESTPAALLGAAASNTGVSADQSSQCSLPGLVARDAIALDTPRMTASTEPSRLDVSSSTAESIESSILDEGEVSSSSESSELVSCDGNSEVIVANNSSTHKPLTSPLKQLLSSTLSQFHGQSVGSGLRLPINHGSMPHDRPDNISSSQVYETARESVRENSLSLSRLSAVLAGPEILDSSALSISASVGPLSWSQKIAEPNVTDERHIKSEETHWNPHIPLSSFLNSPWISERSLSRLERQSARNSGSFSNDTIDIRALRPGIVDNFGTSTPKMPLKPFLSDPSDLTPQLDPCTISELSGSSSEGDSTVTTLEGPTPIILESPTMMLSSLDPKDIFGDTDTASEDFVRDLAGAAEKRCLQETETQVQYLESQRQKVLLAIG